jgi:hypothetical protein
MFESELGSRIVDHIELVKSRRFGLTCDDVKKLACDLVGRNNLWHVCDKDTRIARGCCST